MNNEMNQAAQTLANMIDSVVTQAALKQITIEQAVEKLSEAGVPDATRWVAIGFAALDAVYFEAA